MKPKFEYLGHPEVIARKARQAEHIQQSQLKKKQAVDQEHQMIREKMAEARRRVKMRKTR